MGLEGHTEAESEEAMDPNNISAATRTLQHRHDLKGTFEVDDPLFHDTDFRHYQWQVHTIAPLYFEIRITPLYTHIEFIQPLPRPTKMFKTADQCPPFKYATGQDITYIIYPYDSACSLMSSVPTLTGVYQTIFDECLRMYYLYCDSITRVAAMEKMYSRYGVYSK
jgi:hypothetical protein